MRRPAICKYDEPMVQIPADMNDWLKAGLACIVILGAIYIQSTTGSIPDWLLIAFTGIIAYYFGLTSNSRKP